MRDGNHIGLKFSPERSLVHTEKGSAAALEWHDEFTSPAIKSKEYDLMVDEVGTQGHTNIFSFDLLSRQGCDFLINLAEAKGGWTRNRHENYPTMDMLIEDIGMKEAYDNFILKEFVCPAANHLWKLEGSKWKPSNCTAETFLVKYDTTQQSHLSLHHDAANYTCVVALNDDFEGGGTYFDRQKLLLRGKVGGATLHPGEITHRHGARTVTEGVRYVLISFIRSENFNG
jgi:hypothetical protein|tara:strand:- start:3652 stop:4338 length:687 start_codon:yes stop_codon:yes gene_type:complete